MARAGLGLEVDVFPARAGMIPVRMAFNSFLACIPRESGDDPNRLRNWKKNNSYSRESGDDPVRVKTVDQVAVYSPRERG